MRRFLGIVAGVAVAMVTILVVEFAGHAVYPPPAGVDMSTPAAVSAYIDDAPAGSMLFIVAAWFLGAMAGGWTALAIARWSAAPFVIAALIAAGGIYNATQIPAPMWMQLATVLAPALGGWAALHLPARGRA